MHPQRYHLLLAFFICLWLITTAQAQTSTASLTISNALSCSQLSATLTAATSCTGAVTYRFTGPNDFVLETTTPVASVTVDGEYTVVTSNTNTGCTATRSATLLSSLHPDYLPLVDFYRSTNGPNWIDNTGWLSNCEPCSGWHGIECDERGYVQELSLQSNRLSGSLPNSISKLIRIQRLDLFANGIKGGIPISLGGTNNLVELTLGNSQLTGVIPESIGKLSNLKVLSLFSNQLEGELPSSLTALSSLQILVLAQNKLNGSLPKNIGKLSSLLGVGLGGNQFTGEIPVSLSALAYVQSIVLENNRLTGSIPEGLGKLEMITSLDLSNNQLNGEIPVSLSVLTSLGILRLSSNQLTGTIPLGLTKLVNLQDLNLSDNQLTGYIPEGFGDLNKVYLELNLSYNRLEGEIPKDLGKLTKISSLRFNNNRLSGCFPNSLSVLCGKWVNFLGNRELPSNGDFSAFCRYGAGSDQFASLEVSQSLVQSGNAVSFTASGGASYTWTAPAGATLVSPAVAPSITALVSGNGPRNFTLSATNDYCSQIRVASVTSVEHPDYILLSEFFTATNGPNWLNKTGWLSSLDPCNGWFGISCQNGRVHSLSLPGNQLQGTLPENLTALTNLQVLNLSTNQLRGCFPASLSAFCGRIISLQNNPELPGGGHWTSFCINRLGSSDFVAIAKVTPNPVSLGGVTSLSALGGTLYRWSGPQNFTSNQAVVSLSVLSGEQQGLYSVTVGNGSMNCSLVATTSLTIANVSCVKLSPLVSSSSICTRGIVTITVSATSPEAVFYQWYKGATALSNSTATLGATSATLVMGDLPLSGTGTYYVVASSGCGSSTSTLFSLSVSPPTHPDYLPLADLFYSTNGLSWNNRTKWLTNCDPCTGWFGINCYDNITQIMGNRVLDIDMVSNSMRGTLQESISVLTELQHLVLSGNSLHGIIPNTLGTLNKLRWLTLSFNQFTGQIPVSIKDLLQLELLALQSNQLSGEIPNEFGNLQNLEYLFLGSNKLTGSIPPSLGRLTKLSQLNCSNNQLSGYIPDSFYNLSALKELYLEINSLSGSIPQSFSVLQNLTVLRLYFNNLTGTIPNSLSALTSLNFLALSYNQLSGEIPTGFSALVGLRYLLLDSNQLTGIIPSSLSALTGLSVFRAHYNRLSGSIPFSLGNLTNLEEISLIGNQLTGSIPSSLSRLGKLRMLRLEQNQLSGCIPLSLTSLCAPDISVDFSNNPGLPGGGNWSAFCSTGAGSYAGTLTTTKAGIWTDGSVWSCGAVPQAGDRVIVQHPVTVTPVPLNFVNQVRFEGAGKLIYEAGGRLQMK